MPSISRFLVLITSLIFLGGVNFTWGQKPGYYFGPRIELGQTRFTGRNGFYDGLGLQIGLTSSRQFHQGVALQFIPYVGVYNGQRQNGEPDVTYPNGTRRVLTYRDKYNIYSVEFPLLIKFSGGFRSVNFAIVCGPSLGYLMGGTRSKQYDDPAYNADHGYNGHAMNDLKRGMYSGDVGVCAELPCNNGLVAVTFRIHHNFSPLGRLDGNYFSGHTMTIGLARTFDAL